MRTRIVFAAIAGLLAFAPSAFAQQPGEQPQRPRRPASINARQERQIDRIRAGRQAGEINNQELRRLQQTERRIRREEQRFRRSGDGLTRREFGRIQRDLNQANRQIRRSTHIRRHR